MATTKRITKPLQLVVEITIPYPTPSLNAVRRMHHQTYRRLRDELTVFVQWRIYRELHCPSGERRTVTVTRHSPRGLDFDNLAGGAKPLIDALKRSRLIEDDRPACAELVYEQVKSTRKGSKTIVRIER